MNVIIIKPWTYPRKASWNIKSATTFTNTENYTLPLFKCIQSLFLVLFLIKLNEKKSNGWPWTIVNLHLFATAICHALGHLPDLLLSSSPPHSQALIAVPSLPQDHPSFFSLLPCSLRLPPPGTLHLLSICWKWPFLLGFTDSLALSLLQEHPSTQFFNVCGSNQRPSHGDGRISELVLTCAYQSYIVFLCWRFQCSWIKVGFGMWLKLSWSIYIQNILFLI